MHFPINKEGSWNISLPAGLAVVSFLLNLYLTGIVFSVLTGFGLYFFRDPERSIKLDENRILSAADGTVQSIKELKKYPGFKGPVKAVHIFLSPFNVHINRMPVSGKILSTKHTPGKFKLAFLKTAHGENEKNEIVIQGNKSKIAVTQISGFFARRIRCWAKIGTDLKQGKRFGMIKYGSGTRIIVPKNVKIEVNEKDKVKGGISIIGTYQKE